MNKFVVCMTIANSNICFIKNFFERGGGGNPIGVNWDHPPPCCLNDFTYGLMYLEEVPSIQNNCIRTPTCVPFLHTYINLTRPFPTRDFGSACCSVPNYPAPIYD